jgi:hypothetical protein
MRLGALGMTRFLCAHEKKIGGSSCRAYSDDLETRRWIRPQAQMSKIKQRAFELWQQHGSQEGY